MHLASMKQSLIERLGYGNSHRYQHLGNSDGAFDILKTKGSRLQQRIIAGSVVSVLLVLLCLLVAPSTSLPSSLEQNSISKWWNAGNGKNGSATDSKWQTQQDTCEAMPDEIQVAILETVGAHDEVDAALVHSLGSQPNTNVDLYQKRPRFGSGKIIQAFSLISNLTGPNHPDDFMKKDRETKRPDILVLTTCEFGIRDAENRLAALLVQGKTRLICVVHHADHWALPDKEAGIRPWVDKGMVEFWTLSPHTAAFLRTVINAWDKSPAATIRAFVPVFPVTLPTESNQSEHELSFALQGDYDPHRRDYKRIFQRLGTFLHDEAGSKQNISMHLLGQGNRPEVPEDVRDHVFFDQGLSYMDFYAVLSRVSAVMPSFASAEYLDRKASSSVPAALIAGTPLVASQEVLDAYSYVNADSVWLQADGENEFDVVSRMLAATSAERAEKNANARANCESIFQTNIVKVGEWIHKALYDLHCKSVGRQ